MDQLCSVCKKIDFQSLFQFSDRTGNHETFTKLPYEWYKGDVTPTSPCPFCRLLAHACSLYRVEAGSGPKIGDDTSVSDLCKFWTALLCEILPPEKWVIKIRQDTYMQIGQRADEAGLIRLNLGLGSTWYSPFSIYCCAQPVLCQGRSFMLGARPANTRALDVDLARSWIRTCVKEHPSCHGKTRTLKRGVKLRLIDMAAGCIVDAPDICEYAALSYTWGETAKQTLKLERQNHRLFQQPEYLVKNSNLLSRTVWDAIVLCQRLDMRYLWIDSLCIIQDCETDKNPQIKAMGDIYSNAVITIVGAAGSDSDAGLSRVTAETQTTGLHKGMSLTEEVDGVRMTVVRDNLDHVLHSPWNGRAWTFQERLLSRRLLIVASDITIFCCNEAIWREDIATESVPRDSVLSKPHSRDAWLERKTNIPNGPGCLFNYLILVNEYVNRRLSNEKNRIDGFHGVVSEFATLVGDDFSGIPEGLLWALISWSAAKPGNGPVPVKRNGTHFPSWTWAGWDFTSRGFRIEHNCRRPSKEEPDNSISKCLRIFVFDKDKRFRALERPDWNVEEYWYYPLRDNTPADAVDVIAAQHGHRSCFALKQLLFFWTKCVTLSVGRDWLIDSQAYRIDGGINCLPLPEKRRQSLPDDIEFVQLGDNMWVPVYSEEGITYRLQPTVCRLSKEGLISYTRLVALG